MACGSCGHRKGIQINRPEPFKMPSIQSALPSGARSCPMCQSPMRSLHRYDKNIRKVIRSWYCSKPTCQNSKGSVQ